MKNINLNKNIDLPKFIPKKFVVAILMLILPNVVFLMIAWHAKTARPLINADYFIPLLLFCVPNRWVRLIATLLFSVAMLFDVIMFVMQLFPFMDLAGFLYFAPFIKTAPLEYQIASFIAVFLMIILPVLLIKIAKKTNFYHTLLLVVPLAVVGYFTQFLTYHQRDMQFEIFGENNFYYINSQLNLYQANKKIEFLGSTNITPKFTKYTKARASEHLHNSNKILFVVAESWGRFKNPALHDAVISSILSQKSRFSLFEQGQFPFQDATINGELRELCQLNVVGYALDRVNNELDGCLPHYFNHQGYKTYAMHSTSGRLYERYAWYAKAGFKNVLFSENFIGKKTCTAFHGVCDTQLFDYVKHTMAKDERVFFYWMTLTSHFPYELKDLEHPSTIVCADYGMPEDHYLCKNAKLQKQFFDNLAILLQQHSMKGVEVIVVGDHTPPTDTIVTPVRFLNDTNVAWLHFKIK